MNELYKRHRPKTLRAIVGNDSTVKALQAMLQRNAMPHTLLFHGPSGCGKTTIARILCSELGCHAMDFKEVNSSSFRGIDTIRDIAQNMTLAPVATCRIWLIDECHKLTNDAQNAALKMLEDTPSHVYFFLCTTDPDKLIKPILTRCCEMPVRLLSYDELEQIVKRVLKREKAQLSSDVLDEVVSSAQGSPRTALVLLDKIINLSPEQQLEALQQKLTEMNEAIDLCRALIKRDKWPTVAKLLRALKSDPETVRWSVLGYARSVLLSGKGVAQAAEIIDIFSQPFFNSKDAGLAFACYEAVRNK